MKLSRSPYLGLAFVLVLAVSVGAQIPVGTAFTYQGRLDDGAAPANGIYDLEFALHDADSAGSQIGPTVAKEDVAVANGLFVVALDFGSGAFTGDARWLQIGVRPGSSSDAYSPLASRQELTPAPNAIHATTATATPWSGITGKPTGFADDIDNDSGGDITGVTAGSGLAGGGTTGDVTLSLDTAATDGRYVLKAGDTMTGTLTLSPSSGMALSTTSDIDLLGRVMRGSVPFIHASASSFNTAVGENALRANTNGSFNTAAGYHALDYNTSGYYNTAAGANALYYNTGGYYNTAAGVEALSQNTTGNNNTAAGVEALSQNTSGNRNAATGSAALRYNTTGYDNTAMGTLSLTMNTTGYYNTATGHQALYSNTTGARNTATGQGALYANTAGSNNTAVGRLALYNIAGSNNIAVGNSAGMSATTGNDNIYIGHQGIYSESGAIRIGTGGTHTRFFAAGISGVNVGSAPLVGVTGDGQLGTVAGGAGSGLDSDSVDGYHATDFMGAGVDDWVNATGDTMTGTLTLSPATGVAVSTTADVNLEGRVMRGATPFIHADTSLSTTAVGESALEGNTTGSGNTALGVNALLRNTTGGGNTAIGYQALQYSTTGNDNTAIGTGTLYENGTGYCNTAVGEYALDSNTTGYYNTALGYNSLSGSSAGNFNAVVGANALGYSNGSYNIAVGYRAGLEARTGNYNIYIGNRGVAADANMIRLGTAGEQARFFAAGIRDVATGEDDALPVVIDSAGQLGTVSSSIRFKEDVRDMSDVSAALLQLRPVTFRYKGRSDVPGVLHYGLVAEEVNEVIPELVARSADGQVETVKYHELPAMLLNEIQRLHREVQELRAQGDEIKELSARLAQLEGR